MADSEKRVENMSFKGGVMSPNSKQTFADLRRAPRAISKQQLICEEDIFEQKFLRCLVCRERFDLVNRSPRLLPCHHAFCAECIDMFFRKESEYRQSLSPIGSGGLPYAVSITCPSCTTNFITTEEGLKQLAMDHRIVQLIDFIGDTDKQTASFCPKHASQPLNFFCEECIQAVCRDCTVLDHKKCANQDKVQDIHGALERFTSLMVKGIQDMDDEAKQIEEKKELLTSKTETVDKGKDDLCENIKDAFERLRTALADRETELLEMAGSQSGKSDDSTEDKLKYLNEKDIEVSQNKSGLQAAKLSGEIVEMVKIHRTVSEYKSEPVKIVEKEVESQTTSTFHARDESILISRIANFGDIQTSTSRSGRGYSSSTSGSDYMGSTSRYTGSSYTNRYVPKYTVKKY